jgi:polyhydroxyalkanoate synthesis regulator phasin
MNRLLTAIRREAKADESADKLAGWLEAHPRQAEVLRRDWAEEGRVDRLYAEGKITAKQRDQILAELRKVVQEDHADAKANHGLTPEEQAALNRQENAVNGQIGKDVVVDRQVLTRWLAAHPRQAEVLRRDWAEEGRVDRLFADGKITAQQRDLILAELRKVAQDDHADAKASHGLTPEEQADLNRMENKINGQVSGDEKSDAAWADAHPRQAEVLRRDRFEQDRIKALVASGQISEAQGQAVLAELKDVALEDYADAKANGGNITKSEQSVMNQQENEINKTITTDKQ